MTTALLEGRSLTEEHDMDKEHENLLWAVVGQAAGDATSGQQEPTRDGDCVWRADEAMTWLRQMFGEEHRIVRGVQQLRAEGKHIHVNLHEQDNRRKHDWEAK